MTNKLYHHKLSEIHSNTNINILQAFATWLRKNQSLVSRHLHFGEYAYDVNSSRRLHLEDINFSKLHLTKIRLDMVGLLAVYLRTNNLLQSVEGWSWSSLVDHWLFRVETTSVQRQNVLEFLNSASYVTIGGSYLSLELRIEYYMQHGVPDNIYELMITKQVESLYK